MTRHEFLKCHHHTDHFHFCRFFHLLKLAFERKYRILPTNFRFVAKTKNKAVKIPITSIFSVFQPKSHFVFESLTQPKWSWIKYINLTFFLCTRFLFDDDKQNGIELNGLRYSARFVWKSKWTFHQYSLVLNVVGYFHLSFKIKGNEFMLWKLYKMLLNLGYLHTKWLNQMLK